MQTFLPYPSFEQTAKCLDYRRLGKQRVEAWQIYQCLTGKGSLRWKNHPAVKMWKGYEFALCFYGMKICEEWIRRGYNDTLLERFTKCFINDDLCSINLPHWFNYEDFHKAHRSNLLRKAPEYYSKFGWSEPDNLQYVWPVD